jgi:hypothetical protein
MITEKFIFKSTSTPLDPEWLRELTNMIVSETLRTINETQKLVVHTLWSALLSFFEKNWLIVIGVIFTLLVVSLVKAMTGWWGMLGSILYNLLYFGILFVVGLIFGPEVFISDYFHELCVLILYPICFFVVGLILGWIGVRKFQAKRR